VQRITAMTRGQSGGSQEPLPETAPLPANNQAVGEQTAPPVDDPSRSKFWDVVISKRLYELTKGLPPGFDAFAPIIFALYGAEQIEIIGPLLATGFDSITLGLPILGKLLGTSFSKIVALAPIPYAGVVGDVVAYFVSLVFIMLSATMSVSRKQFGTSFTVGIGAVPVIGDNLSDAALLLEKQVERYENNKKKFLASLNKVTPHLANFLDYYLPGKEEKSGPPPPFTLDDLWLDLITKVAEKEEVKTVLDALPFPEEIPESVKAKARTIESNKSGGRRRTRRVRRR
jgi:hypothetical protein